ncbi:MAG: fibronectin type III domain-containing protein [Vicinamibacterales bacterium]
MPRALVVSLAVALLVVPPIVAAQSLPATAPLNTAGPNGPVAALARSGNTLFVGGSFDRVAMPAPGLAVLATTNGAQRGGANVDVDAAMVAGIPAGGWIVAGRITGGGAPRRLARFDAAGVLDQSWNVDYDQFGSITFLAVQGSTVLIGGNLRSVNGVARTSLAAVDATTGAVLPWNPKLSSALGHPLVVKGLLHQGRVFLYGQFDQVNNQAVASGFAVVDATSAALIPTTPPPGAAANIQTWAAVGDNLFVLNSSAPAGQRLAIASGQWSAWLPTGLTSIATAGTAVFGWSSSSVVELDPTTAAPRGQPFVSAATIAGVTGGASRLFVVRANNHELVALSAANPASVVWRAPVAGVPAPTASNPLPFAPLGVVENGRTTAVWGRFSAVGGDPRPGLLAIDLTTGAPAAFAPVFQGSVNALVTIGGLLVVGGDLVVGGQPTGAIAVDTASGQILSWRPPFAGKVTALALDSAALYFAGDVGLATLSLATLGVTSRQPFNGGVRDLAVANGTLIAGGDFTTADGAARNGAAAFAGGATLTPWDPAARYVFNPSTNASVAGTIGAVATAAGRIALSGFFTHLGSVPAQGFGVFDASGARLPFVLPAAFTRTNDVASDGSRFLVAARRFVDVSPDPFISDSPVLLSAVTGQTLGWSPGFEGMATPTLSTVALYPDAAVVAGEFAEAGGRPALNLAIFPIAPGAAGPPTRLRSQVSGSTLSVNWAAPPGVAPPAYRIDASQGGTPLGSFTLAGTAISAPLSPGVYSLIVRVDTGVAGVPTWPIVLTVPAPAAVPAAPLHLTQAAVNTVTGVFDFAWAPGIGGGNVDSYVIEAGTQSGGVNVGVIDTGVADTTFSVPVPPGTYFIRVRARNAVGVSPPSNEIVVVVTP